VGENRLVLNRPLVPPCRRVVAGGRRTTGNAFGYPPPSDMHTRRVQKRLLALYEACWTKPMRWFGAAFVWLQHISYGPFPNWFKFIILLFSIPCFELSHFCFKRAYAISLRRIRLAGLDGLFESLQNDTLQFDGLGSKRLSIAQTYHRLRDIERRTKAGNSSGNLRRLASAGIHLPEHPPMPCQQRRAPSFLPS
jgi:hypothetical protein